MCSISIGRVLGFVQFFIGKGDINPEIDRGEMDIYDYSLRMAVNLVSALAFQAGVRWLNRYFRSSAATGASRAAVGVPTVHGTELGTSSGRGGAGAGDGGSYGDPSDGLSGQPGCCGGDKPGGGDVVLDIEAE